MNRLIAALLFIALSSAAIAQQPQRPMTAVEMSAALNAAIEQGNIARTMHIQAEAKAAGFADELDKARVELVRVQGELAKARASKESQEK